MSRTGAGPADAVPHNNPCAQCGKPIGAPVWSEPSDDHSVSYVWVCQACNYEFTQIATFRCETTELEHAVAA